MGRHESRWWISRWSLRWRFVAAFLGIVAIAFLALLLAALFAPAAGA